MHRLATFLALFLFLSLSLPVPSRAAGIPLSMESIARRAVLHNPELRSAAFSPLVAGTGVERARAIYDPVLSALLEHRGADTRLAPGSELESRSRTWTSDLSISALLRSGATASASFSGSWRDDESPFSAVEASEPSLSVSLVQPLLKDAGRSVTERGITSASYASRIAEAEWYSQMLSVCARACTRMLDVLKTRESLESRRASLEAAKRLHIENQARVRAGVLAPIDLLDSELGLATREVDLLQAEKAVRDAEDALRFLVGAAADETFADAEPLAEPASPLLHDNAVATALANRPEIRRTRLSVQNEEFNVEVARNQMLPAVSMKGSAGLSGLAGDTPRALGDIAGARYPFWVVGVELTFPVRNGAARADYLASRLRASQNRSSLSALEESVSLEVRNAMRALDTRFRQIGVARKGVEVAEARLSSFIKRNALGMATTRNVLDAETDLTAARESLTLAKADYQAAVVELRRATGELPAALGILVTPEESSGERPR